MDGVIVIVFVFVIDGDVDPYQSKQGAKLELVPEHSCHVATFLPFANLDICALVHYTALQFTVFCSSTSTQSNVYNVYSTVLAFQSVKHRCSEKGIAKHRCSPPAAQAVDKQDVCQDNDWTSTIHIPLIGNKGMMMTMKLLLFFSLSFLLLYSQSSQ